MHNVLICFILSQKNWFTGSHFELLPYFGYVPIKEWFDMIMNAFFEFLNQENVGKDTKIVFLCDLVFKILSILDFIAAILNLGHQ